MHNNIFFTSNLDTNYSMHSIHSTRMLLPWFRSTGDGDDSITLMHTLAYSIYLVFLNDEHAVVIIFYL